MKNVYLLLIFCLTLFTFSCQTDFSQQSTSKKLSAKNASIISIPKLLDRHEKLWHGKEWDAIQSAYVAAREGLSKPQFQNENYLKLAAIFTNEARITGEHGHYYPAALEVLDRVLKNDLMDTDVHFRTLTMKAAVLLSQHEFSDALFYGEKALKLNQHNSQVYGVLVDANVEMGNYEQAVKMADRMVTLRPDLRSYSRVSYLREIYGDIKGAAEAMEMAAEAGMPGYEQTAWTRLTLGELYQKYNQPEKATAQYNKILTERENYPFAIAALADVYFQKGKFDQAEALLKEACAIIPEVGFYAQLAFLYQKTNRTNDFQQIIPEIFEMLQDDVDHGHNMNLEYADLYLNLTRDYDKALEFALREYNTRPENIDVNRMLAMIYFEKEDFEQASKFAERASRTNSVHPDLVAVKAMLQNQLAQK